MTEIRLAQLLAPAYFAAHHAVQAHEYTHYIFSGGRGSGKSSFAAMEVLLLLKRHPLCHALVLRKQSNTLRESVFGQYRWALEKLGLTAEFEVHLSTLSLVSKATGQSILFRGLQDAGVLKSLKLPFGYIGITHFEEADQFAGAGEIRTLLQSTMRGGEVFWNFETYNPPQEARHWVNRQALEKRADTFYLHTDYRCMPRAWLGEAFLAEAEALQKQNEAAYRHEYLGQSGTQGDSVFANVTVREISEAEKARFANEYCGVDWGFYPDPFAANRMRYDAARRTLYICDEVHAVRKSNAETAKMLRALPHFNPETVLFADSAEPKSVADYRAAGLACRAVHKGPGSVAYTMKWLAALREIVIDKARCPHTAQEFTAYSFMRDANGEVLCAYPDRDNHHIDAVRYGLYPVWRQRGA